MYYDHKIWIGDANGEKVCIVPKMANRHGLIAGATGTGKTVTLNKRPGGNNAGIAFYSSNTEESFISGLTNNNTSPSQKWTFTVPENLFEIF